MMMVTGLLTMDRSLHRSLHRSLRHSPLEEDYGRYGDCEIDGGQNPEAAPIARDLPQAGAKLIDADDAIDGEVRRKDVADGLDGVGDRLARPGETGEEKLRQAGAEENQRRGFGMFEPGA